MRSGRDRLITVVLVALIAVGLSLLLYPSVSDWWNSKHQTSAVTSYGVTVEEIDDDTRNRIWADAAAYNEALAERGNSWVLSDEQKAEYESQLSVDDTGIMCYIDIPCIRCTLPVYHGTDEEILQIAAGHIEGSSLPVGGESSHSVISGHRGLPSAKLFTSIDQLVEGDVFTLRVLDETLTYEVDQILIVLPHETKALEITRGEDYCTLVTCTPYGINSHRLLVRGHRIDNIDDVSGRVTSDAILVDPEVVALYVAVPILVVLFIAAMTRNGRRHG